MTSPSASSVLDRFIAAVDALSDYIGRAVSWLTLFMVLAAVGTALLRYIFSIGFVWMQESYLWMHGALMMLGASYALRHDAHVRVDVFYGRMSPRRRAMRPLRCASGAQAWP